MADLDKARRGALPDSEFAVPGKRKLPIPDKHHVRLAWDMVDRTQGLTSEERRVARERIKRRAHEFGIDTGAWLIDAAVSFDAMALALPDVADHPNRRPFRGVLTRIDQPSDAPPGGSSGKRTLIPKDVAESALPSLLGMAVDFTDELDGHDRQQKIGIITGAEIVGDAIEIEGFFYAKDFPDEVERICAEKGAMGFSFEADARIRDTDADIWELSYCVFTGAAVLYKHLAAYTTTSLAAKAEKEKEQMDLKELLEAMKGIQTSVNTLQASIDGVKGEVAEIKAKGASLGGPIIDQVKPHVDSLNAAADSMEAAGIGTHSDNGHVKHLRHMAAHLCAEAVSGRVPHVYRDHDYLSDARVEAGKGKLDPKAIEEAVKKAVEPLQSQLEAANTTIKDLQAKAFNNTPAPARATLTPEIRTLLAKGGLTEEQVDSGKLTVEQVDKALEAAGISGRKAIEAKLKLMHTGVMPARKAA